MELTPLAPAARGNLLTTAAGLAVWPDGTVLSLLDAADGKLVLCEATTLAPKAEIPLPRGVRGMSLSPIWRAPADLSSQRHRSEPAGSTGST